MVVLNILRRQREKLLGPQVTVDIKDPYSEGNLKENSGFCGFSYCTTLFLCLTVVLMVTLICTSGVYFYDEYRQAKSHSFQGWCKIPIPKEMMKPPVFDELIDIDSMRLMETFHEDFEISLDEDQANINVPDFQDGRRGRYMHDFNTNFTGIVDAEGKRCFVMPLDRTAVLPPQSLMDMITKMMEGHYNVNMTVVKQNMVVVVPPIQDFSKIGWHIRNECHNFPIYKLEKATHSVVRRSVDEIAPVKFREFAGNGLQEFDILNFEEMINFENGLKEQI